MMIPEPMTATIDTLSPIFRRFGERECQHASPLYARLAVGIADDPALLQIATAAQSRPVPNLFLAAVQYLLLKGAGRRLAAFYPGIAGSAAGLSGAAAQEQGDSFPLFRAFCLEHAAQIRELLATRRVQTNEVRRCACLMPAFVHAARQAAGRPLTLVEIGASAGFNLLWDRYGYDYGAGQRCGDLGSPVQLACELRGSRRPPLATRLPEVDFRVGLDLNPLDVGDADAMLWLRALVWPEQQDRAALLERAIEVARQRPPRLLAGDALDLLPGAMASAPAGAALCVFHTFTLNQFPRAARERFAALIAEHAAQRDMWVIAIEWREPYPSVVLTRFEAGARSELNLAYCDAHGAWLEWIAEG
jgi:hypothetical protein